MDNSRLFLYAALVFVGMLLFQQWEKDYGPQPIVVTQANNENGTAIPSTNDATLNNSDLPELASDIIAGSGDLPSSSGAANNQPQRKLIKVDTDVVQALIDSKGGVLVSLKLKQYSSSVENPEDWLELIHQESDSKHILQSGLLNKEKRSPTHYSLYSSDKQQYELSQGSDELIVPLYWIENGVKVIKTYHFKRDNYLVTVKHRIENNSGSDWLGSEYRQITRSRPLDTSRLLYTYTGGVYYNEEIRFEKVDFDDIEETKLNLSSKGGWIGMIQHYFLSAWIPAQESKNQIYTIAVTNSLPAAYTIGMRSDNKLIAVGQSAEFSSDFFVGPKLVKTLEEVSPGLELTVDYGVLTFLSKPLYWLLSFYHSYVGNWGFAIMLLTLTVKLVFYKLSETSYRSMARMRKISPRMKTLKERYGDDRQKLNKAMMELYKTEKINPMGGCLPILVQIPVFIALYWALLESVDLRQAPFILWIQDLSVQDPFYVLPLIMGISMFIQQRLNPPPPDPIQAKIMMALPFIFTIFFAFFPAGLVLYWVVNNVLSISQQYVITKRIEAGGK